MHVRRLIYGFQPLRSPDEPAADDPYAEQPGDREPEAGEVVEPQPEPEPAEEAEPVEEPTPEEGETEPEPEAAAEGEEADEPAEGEEPKPKADWRARQVQKERQKRQELEQKLKESEARAKALEEFYAKPEAERGEGEGLMSVSEAREAALAQVRKEQYYQTLNAEADKLFEAGKTAFPKTWEGRVREAGEALREEILARPDFIESLTALENAPQVYHELAGDLDHMERVLALPAHKMGIELAKLSASLQAPKPKPISRVPAPIVPLEKPTKAERPLEDLANDPNASMEEFDRRMTAAEKARFEARRG